MARSTKPTPKKERRDWKPRFLASLMRTPNVSAAAKSAGINRSYAYDTRKVDEAFAAAWDEAVEVSIDKLEAEALKRALKGSDTLAIFLLKAHRPKYRETARSLNVTVTSEQLASMSDDDLDRLIDSLAR